MATPTLVNSIFKIQGSAATVQPPSVRLVELLKLSSRYNPYSGAGIISGTVKVVGVLARRRVSLFERVSLHYIESVWSDEITGEFLFTGLSEEREYLVLVDDSNQIYNAAVADWVQIDD